jgi:hypothetical protein
MTKAIEYLLAVLENPFIKKGYEDLRDCYFSSLRLEDAEAFQAIIERRFHEYSKADNVPSDSEQRDDSGGDPGLDQEIGGHDLGGECGE